MRQALDNNRRLTKRPVADKRFFRGRTQIPRTESTMHKCLRAVVRRETYDIQTFQIFKTWKV